MKKLLLLILLSGCASQPFGEYLGEPELFAETKIVYRISVWSDWMLHPDRDWITENNNFQFHLTVGPEWNHQIRCPFISTGTDSWYRVIVGCSKAFGSYDPGRRFNFFAELELDYQVDQWSSWWRQPERTDWMGDGLIIGGRFGLMLDNKSRCPTLASETRLGVGGPFHSNSPELYVAAFECGIVWGGR